MNIILTTVNMTIAGVDHLRAKARRHINSNKNRTEKKPDENPTPNPTSSATAS